MKLQLLLGLLLAAAVSVAGCRKQTNETVTLVRVDPTEPTQAQPKLQTVKLWLGPEEMEAEMALTEAQIRTGMMFRTNMAENEGMIFVFPFPQRAYFWMKNCPLPLSVAYINTDGAIAEIHDMLPFNTNSIISAMDTIRYALETRQGWFRRHNIHEGTIVRTEHGSLQETFRTRP